MYVQAGFAFELLLALLETDDTAEEPVRTRTYMRPIHITRNQLGCYTTQGLPYRVDDTEFFRCFTGVSRALFADLLAGIAPLIVRPPNHRYPLSADMRLMICLRYVQHHKPFASRNFFYTFFN